MEFIQKYIKNCIIKKIYKSFYIEIYLYLIFICCWPKTITIDMLVVVIGAAGFLGQHVLRLMHTRWNAPDKIIRVFDLLPFRKRLDYNERLCMEIIVGSVCCLDDVRTAVEGADVVFHLASVISYGTSPNYKGN